MSDDNKVVSIESFMKKKPAKDPVLDAPKGTYREPTIEEIRAAGSSEEAMKLFDRDEHGNVIIPASLIRSGITGMTMNLLPVALLYPEYMDQVDSISLKGITVLDILDQGNVSVADNEKMAELMRVMAEEYKELMNNVASKIQ